MIVSETFYPVETFRKGYGYRAHGPDRVGRAVTWFRIHDDGSAEGLVWYDA